MLTAIVGSQLAVAIVESYGLARPTSATSSGRAS